ncbi:MULTISPECIES: hypothetical protein [unclassified Flavobacterium]|uniref:hypothetical protein n=1 Tax=unclassified Flavobacterium TaxID=196869 RepID=UPI00361E1267
MRSVNPALALYVIAGIIFFISSMAGNEYLVFISKPVVPTAIMFYYWQESDGKVNPWHILVLLFFFVSGILNLFEDVQALLYILILNAFGYGILISHIIKSLFEVKIRFTDKVNLAYIFLMVLFLSCLMYVLLFMIFDTSYELYVPMVVYGCILSSLVVLNSILYNLKHTKADVYLMLTSFCYLMADLFYVVYYYYFDFILFRCLTLMANIVSYYFLVRFFLITNKTKM